MHTDKHLWGEGKERLHLSVTKQESNKQKQKRIQEYKYQAAQIGLRVYTTNKYHQSKDLDELLENIENNKHTSKWDYECDRTKKKKKNSRRPIKKKTKLLQKKLI